MSYLIINSAADIKSYLIDYIHLVMNNGDSVYFKFFYDVNMWCEVFPLVG